MAMTDLRDQADIVVAGDAAGSGSGNETRFRATRQEDLIKRFRRAHFKD